MSVTLTYITYSWTSSSNNMADEEMKTSEENPNIEENQTCEVFVNGNNDNELKPECSNDSEATDFLPTDKTLPRKSSFMSKDGSRRTHSRKKTVSFSSMPTERKIATGKNSVINMHLNIHLMVCNI